MKCVDFMQFQPNVCSDAAADDDAAKLIVDKTATDIQFYAVNPDTEDVLAAADVMEALGEEDVRTILKQYVGEQPTDKDLRRKAFPIMQEEESIRCRETNEAITWPIMVSLVCINNNN